MAVGGGVRVVGQEGTMHSRHVVWYVPAWGTCLHGVRACMGYVPAWVRDVTGGCTPWGLKQVKGLTGRGSSARDKSTLTAARQPWFGMHLRVRVLSTARVTVGALEGWCWRVLARSRVRWR